MKIVKGCLLFGAGFIAGAVVAARVVRDKFRQEAEEEIAEMREYYREKERGLKQNDDSQPVEEKEDKKENEKEKYEKIVKEKGYVDYAQYNDTKPDKKDEVVDDEEVDPCPPIIIDPEEFGEDPSYDTVTLTYFKDGVLADEVDEEVDPKIVGLDNLETFNEFGARSIYIRDELEMIEYEIIRDDYAYSEYTFYNLSETRDEKKPHEL